MELKRFYPHLIFCLVTLLIIYPFFLDKYVLTLDTIVSPSTIHGASHVEDFIYGLWLRYPNQDELGLSASRIPLLFVSVGLQKFISTSILQKAEIFLIFFLSMTSMYSLIETKSRIPRYFAAFLYAINPFVYFRFLAGHWLILLAYAILPFLLKEILGKKRALHLVLWLSLISILSNHIFFLSILVFLAFFRLNEIKKYALVFSLFFLLNLYWIVPLFLAKAAPLSAITYADVDAFETNETFFSQLLSVAMLHGFWREDAYLVAPLFYLLPLFALVLFLVVRGCSWNDKRVIILGLIGFVMALGTSFPLLKDLFLFIFENIPFMEGFRESNKFVVLIVIAYCVLAAKGMQDFPRKVQLGLLLIPLLFTPFIFFGFFGQLRAIDYPSDYYEMNGILKENSDEFNVLFLPWHLYMDFSWIENRDKRIANPSAAFFERPIIRGDNMEVGGIYSSSQNAVSDYVRRNLNGTIDSLQILNVKYVLVAREFDQTIAGTDLVKETKNLKLFKTKYDSSLFMQTDDFAAYYPLKYEKINPITYKFEKPQKKYAVFAKTRNDGWKLGDQSPREGYPVNVFEYGGERIVYYSKSKFYFFGYTLSIISLALTIYFRKRI